MFVKNLQQMLAPTFSKHYNEVPVLKTVASNREGIAELFDTVIHQLKKAHLTDKHFWLLAEKAYYLIQQKRMKGVDKAVLKKEIEEEIIKGKFNLYAFVQNK
jgi:LAO/AO transport system kinase